jgi:hypothetical protein
MLNFLRFIPACALAAALGTCCSAWSVEKASSDDPNVAPTIELTAATAAEPRPALKYRLAIDVSERKPGNAATHYYRAIILQRQQPKEYWQESADNSAAWNEGPDDKFPKAAVEKWLSAQHGVIADIKEAAYKEHCDWGLRLQDLRGPELFSYLIPEVQQSRDLARTLRLKARLDIVEGRHSDALETLRQGYQLARDTTQTPFIVAGLVGVAIESIMTAELEHLITTSGDNYYWAVATLEQPVADVRPALQFEMSSPFRIFPFLKDAETAARSPEEWRSLIVRGLADLADLGGPGAYKGWQGEIAAAGLMAKLYPAAKQELLASGMDREKVESMSVGQAVAVQTARATESLYQELFKYTLLPAAEAIPRLSESMRRLEKEQISPDAALSGKIGLPIANFFLPSVTNVLLAEVRNARNLAALQAIEAIRMHTAVNGALPATLSDITIVPVPPNPATAQPFAYKLDASAGVATLDVPPSASRQARYEGKHYVLRLRK